MSTSSLADPRAASLLARFGELVDELQSFDFATLTDEDCVNFARDKEVLTNRLAAVDHAVINEIEQRGLAGERGCSSTAVLLTQALRVSPHEASARVRAAGELGARRALTGEVLEPIFAKTAECVAAGQVSARHAQVITKTITKLPAALAAEHDLSIERFLLERAEEFNPSSLASLARRITDTLNPDGTFTEEADRQRTREFTAFQRADGSGRLSAELDAIAMEAVLTVLDTLARPAPATDGAADPRTAAQRRHDAFRDAMLMVLRAGELPDCGGVAATILLMMTPDQFEQRHGLADTGHGASIPVAQALTLVGDAHVMPILRSHAGRLEAYGSSHRIFTARQRLAMTARDRGCSFPGCTKPPSQCEAHHVIDFALTRHTRVDDGTLLCGFHHREHPKLGWHCTMLNGIPHWTPPRWIDPTQTPRRNRAHATGSDLAPV